MIKVKGLLCDVLGEEKRVKREKAKVEAILE